MKLELITALIGATAAATIVSAQEDEAQFAFGRHLLSRLDRGGRGEKEKGKEVFQWNSPAKPDNNWTSPNKPSANNNWMSPNKPSGRTKSSKSAYYNDVMFLVPFECPRKCVDGVYQPNSSTLGSAVQDCNVMEDTQQWNIHYNDQFMKFEGHASFEKHWCIGVDSLATCKTSKAPLSFVPCDDPRSDWYFTGGRLISGYCWVNNVSSVMSADCEGLLHSSTTMDSYSMFMLVGKDYIASIPSPTQAPSKSSAPSK